MNAIATSISAATVTWTAVPGSGGYQVYRSSMNGAFAPAPGGSVPSTTFNDSGLTADTTYLYEVRATAGAAASPLSALDAATTTDFSTDPVAGGTIIRATQIAKLRVAVNAMRAATPLGPQVFADDPVTTSTPIRALHITELRTALDQARAALGLPALAYTDGTIPAGTTAVKAAHIVDLRNGVK